MTLYERIEKSSLDILCSISLSHFRFRVVDLPLRCLITNRVIDRAGRTHSEALDFSSLIWICATGFGVILCQNLSTTSFFCSFRVGSFWKGE